MDEARVRDRTIELVIEVSKGPDGLLDSDERTTLLLCRICAVLEEIAITSAPQYEEVPD